MNYLRPNLKHGPFSVEEEQLILQLQQQWGNKWSKIARSLPGRTDNEIKNYWRTHLRKKARVEQDEFQYKLDNTGHDVFNETNIDMVSTDYNQVNLEFQENDAGTEDRSIHPIPLSDWELTSSPYEIRISDWIAALQKDHSRIEYEHDCQNTGTCFGFDYDTWGHSDSLWVLN